LPIHLFIPELKRLAAALLLIPLAASAQERGLPDGLYAEISTAKGVITCELDFERAPLTVANFVGLAEGTLGPAPRRPFFDGLTFHRVVPDFVIQGGDPLGTGEGGPGYSFPDEFSAGLGHGSTGILSMANDGPDTNGSQFFITLAPCERLNFLYSVFGRVVGGSGIPARIVQGDAMHVHILRLGSAARAFRADDAAFAALSAKAAKYIGEKVPGPKAHFDDPGKLLPPDPPRTTYYNYKLANVERSTGVRIYSRIFAKFMPGATGDTPQAFTERLSGSLGLRENGILAAYFADSGKWCLSIGNSMVEKFTARHGAAPNETVAASVDAFLANAQKRKTRYAAEAAASLTKNLQSPGHEIAASVSATLDELIYKLTL
jgi:cyclophilin family peptidyl-prolyl cis-trans isomerase